MTYDTERQRMGRRHFTVVELLLDLCQLTYGVSPCIAAVGVTGTQKCFNTRNTCQDSANYDPAAHVYRFCSNIADVPRDLDALPFLESVSIQPAELAIGAGLGKRGTATLTFTDARHNDVDVDPYVAERSYDPLKQGTYWGRFVNRNAYYLGRQLKVKTGYLVRGASGAFEFDESNFQTRLYFIEKIEGPDASGRVTITAKDILKLADDDRAKAPKQSNGRLNADITAAATSAVLKPTGIGDEEYPASGKVRINGEVMSFTRSADTLTLSNRGSHFTAVAEHKADDQVQLCLEYTALPLHAIAEDLLTDYAGIPATFIPSGDWDQEDIDHNLRLYSTLIAEPTGVNKLMNELCEQGPAYFWWDEIASQIRYRALRPASSAGLTLSDRDHFIAGSLQVEDRLDLRVSTCIVHFGQRNPTEPLDKRSNYAAAYALVGDGEGVSKYGQPRIKEIFSRFIPSSARTFAEQIASSVIQRFDEVPKQLSFRVLPKDELKPADLFVASTRLIQAADGSPSSVTLQVLSSQADYRADERAVTALQERFVPDASTGQRIVTFSADELDRNLRVEHDKLYAAPTEAVEVLCIIEAGAVIGSSSAATPAFDVGDWPAGSDITIRLLGRIQGHGGDGAGTPGGNFVNATPGGPALRTRVPIVLDLTQGVAQIWSGGGGGGGERRFHSPSNTCQAHAGCGGAGTLPGIAGVAVFPSEDGAPDAGGTSGGPDGGNPGEDGQNGEALCDPGFTPAAWLIGGAAGPAIDGASFVTITGTPDIRGPQIN